MSNGTQASSSSFFKLLRQKNKVPRRTHRADNIPGARANMYHGHLIYTDPLTSI